MYRIRGSAVPRVPAEEMHSLPRTLGLFVIGLFSTVDRQSLVLVRYGTSPRNSATGCERARVFRATPVVPAVLVSRIACATVAIRARRHQLRALKECQARVPCPMSE